MLTYFTHTRQAIPRREQEKTIPNISPDQTSSILSGELNTISTGIEVPQNINFFIPLHSLVLLYLIAFWAYQ